MTDPTAWRILAAPIVAAFVLRAFVLFGAEYALSPDGVTNVVMAENLSDGTLEELSYFHPLYPILMFAASVLPLSLERLGQIVSLLAGTLMLVPLHGLAEKMLDRPRALAAVWLASVWPILVLYSVETLNMSLYVFFLVSFLDQGWRSLTESGWRPPLWATLFLVGAYWTRPEAFSSWLMFLGLLLVVAIRRRRWLDLAVAAAAFPAGIFPYILFLKWQTGHWTLSRYLSNLTAHTAAQPVRNLPHNIENETVSFVYALKGMIEHSGAILEKFADRFPKLLFYWYPRAFYPSWLAWFWIALLLLGCWAFWREGRRKGLSWIVLAGFVSMATVALHGGNSRYLVPLVPASLVLIGTGLHWTASRMERYGQVARWAPCAAALVLCLPFAAEPVLREALGKTPYHAIEMKRAGLALKKADLDRAFVLSRKPQIGYYSGLPLRSPREWTSEGIAEEIERGGAGEKALLSLDERDTLSLHPNLKIFLDNPPPDGWKVLYDDERTPRIRVLTPE